MTRTQIWLVAALVVVVAVVAIYYWQGRTPVEETPVVVPVTAVTK